MFAYVLFYLNIKITLAKPAQQRPGKSKSTIRSIENAGPKNKNQIDKAATALEKKGSDFEGWKFSGIIHSDIAPTTALNFTGVKKCNIMPRVSTPVAFDELWLRSKAMYRKHKTSPGAQLFTFVSIQPFRPFLP